MKIKIKDLIWPVLFVVLLAALFFLPSIARADRAILPLVAAGDDHSLAVDEGGNLFAWGSNIYGQLGTAEFEEIIQPKQTLPGKQIVGVSAGSRHSLALTAEGELYAAGEGIVAKAGTEQIGGWKLVMTGVKAVSAGSMHSLALKNNGDVYAFGENRGGALGDGTTENRPAPVKVMTGAVAVEAGGNVSFAVKKNGDLFAWGAGRHGALGTGKTANVKKPTRVMRSVDSVSTSGRHTLIVKKDGTLYGCGQNDFGQLGNGTTKMEKAPIRIAKNMRAVSAGWQGSLAISKDGVLYGFGQIALDKTYSEERESTLYRHDEFNHGFDLYKPTKLAEKVVSAAFGDFHALFVGTDSRIHAFGSNSWGQLGQGDYSYSYLDIQEIDLNAQESTLPEVPAPLKPLGKLTEVSVVEKPYDTYSGTHRVYRFKMLDGTRGMVIAYEQEADLLADWKVGKLDFAHTDDAMGDAITGEMSGHGAEFVLADGKTFVTLDESMPAAIHRVRALTEREGWKKPMDIFPAPVYDWR